MNPIETFEAHFVAACEAKIKPEVRRKRLENIAEAIRHYVFRIRQNSRKYSTEEFRRVEASLRYLDALADQAASVARKSRA